MLLWLLSNAFLSVVPFLEQQKQLCLWAEVIPRTGMGTEKVLHPHLDLCRHPFLRTCHVVPQDSEAVNQINSQFRLLVFDDQICRITTYCVWRYVIGNMWFVGQRTDFEPLVQMACSTQTHLKTLKDKVGTLPTPSAGISEYPLIKMILAKIHLYSTCECLPNNSTQIWPFAFQISPEILWFWEETHVQGQHPLSKEVALSGFTS